MALLIALLSTLLIALLIALLSTLLITLLIALLSTLLIALLMPAMAEVWVGGDIHQGGEEVPGRRLMEGRPGNDDCRRHRGSKVLNQVT